MSMAVGLSGVRGNATGPASSPVNVNVNDNDYQPSGSDYAIGGNRGTSHLGSLEFNTPYAHQIAVLAVVIAVVATVSVFLAVKFTSSASRRPTTTTVAAASAKLSNSSDTCEEVAINDEYDNCDKDDDDGQRRFTWECAPILLHRLGVGGSMAGGGGSGVGGRYESLQQTDCDRLNGGGSGAGGGGGVFHFSARRDPANGLLCLYAMRVVLPQCSSDCRAFVPQSIEGRRQIFVDIVTQTDIEWRQTRLQTRLMAATSAGVLDDDGDEDQTAEGSWSSEPLDDVFTVKLGHQSQDRPLQGQLLISVLGQKSSGSGGSLQQQQKQKSSMVKLGCATFPVDRIVSEAAAATAAAAVAFAVALRGDSQ